MAGSSNKAPGFFTVFLPEFCSHQLKITSSFKAHLRNEVTGEAIIEMTATNEVWKVDLVKEGEDFLFKNGWNEFVNENDITVGEFMVFQYHGNSRFTVDILGTDGLQKLAPGKKTAIFQDDVNDDDEDYNVVDESGKGCMSMNPFSFRVRMTTTYLVKKNMHLPSAFSHRYIKGKDVQRVELKTSEKTWSVDVSSYLTGKYHSVYYLLKGEAFSDFLHHNRVQAGDVFVFEALDLPCTTFSVSILRNRGR